jgi:hypothetical protein
MADSDQLSIEFTNSTADVYPAIHYVSKALVKDGKPFLAVIIPGSDLRPHFTGSSYVRVGSETKKASEAQFNELIAQRHSKVREILKRKGQPVKVVHGYEDGGHGSSAYANVVDCDQFYVTLENNGVLSSVPLTFVELSFHHGTPPTAVLILTRHPYC